MKYLNLSEGFNPYNANDLLNFESFTFSGGEPHIKILIEEGVDLYHVKQITITHRINSFNDLGLLCVAVDALRRLSFNGELRLFIPYFLGARQDRVCNKGEALTVKVVADIINSLNFNFVAILDPHSDVTPALINNCLVTKNYGFVQLCLFDLVGESVNNGNSLENWAKNLLLISPDAGANKKVLELSKNLYHIPIIKCDKTRELKTGKLTGFEVYADDLQGKDCVIVDDICDGGGTFIGLAKELKNKNAGKLYLVVTHGIFSKGLTELLQCFDKIYFTDSIKTYDESLPPQLKQIKI